jgi:putative ABC transport system substrate-binding protein
MRPSISPPIVHIGILNYAGAQYARASDFRSELRRLGYIEGQNLTISHLWADGHLDRLPGLAPELITRKVDLIIALGPSAWAAKCATTTVPIDITSPTRSAIRAWSSRMKPRL